MAKKFIDTFDRSLQLENLNLCVQVHKGYISATLELNERKTNIQTQRLDIVRAYALHLPELVADLSEQLCAWDTTGNVVAQKQKDTFKTSFATAFKNARKTETCLEGLVLSFTKDAVSIETEKIKPAMTDREKLSKLLTAIGVDSPTVNDILCVVDDALATRRDRINQIAAKNAAASNLEKAETVAQLKARLASLEIELNQAQG